MTFPSTSLPLWVRKTCWPWLSLAPGGRLLRKPGPRILVSLCSHTCTTTSYRLQLTCVGQRMVVQETIVRG